MPLKQNGVFSAIVDVLCFLNFERGSVNINANIFSVF